MTRDPLSRFGIVGGSPAMQAVAQWILTAAPLWDPVLLTGERGTGKELAAKAIHKLGPCRGGPMVTVDCAALHAATAESALFGHERGSFTGAASRHTGLLEEADGGTLFVDEIGLLPLELQARFLRFLEDGTLRRVGGKGRVRSRARVVAATNRDLRLESAAGRFLPDLFDRLNVFPLRLPPLRERRDDLIPLVRHWLGGNAGRLDETAVEALRRHDFPGNVRELRNLCRRVEVFHPAGPVTGANIERCLGQ